MLTGVLTPSSGDALVYDKSINGVTMAQIKQNMGVCPQFDILWEGLSAKEHLRLFAVLKGVPDVETEIDTRIEEVKLTFAAEQLAGNFSGGMRRRLSVAVALIGNPAVVYLDEPTTGMDPINRRHVWDVIERAKQERTVILTTHSMEEADILSDRIAIMCKGRLRCIGSSVRLKSRFGSGYKVSVSVGDDTHPDDPAALRVKAVFKDGLDIEPSEENKSYMFFSIPNTDAYNEKIPPFFAQLEAERESLGLKDIQVGMSTLEDVFLEIATATEREEAEKKGARVEVTLAQGEVCEVLLGSQGVQKAKSGAYFEIKWGTDEVGNLDAMDIIMTEAPKTTVEATGIGNDAKEANLHPLGVGGTDSKEEPNQPSDQETEPSVGVAPSHLYEEQKKRGDIEEGSMRESQANYDVTSRVETLQAPISPTLTLTLTLIGHSRHLSTCRCVHSSRRTHLSNRKGRVLSAAPSVHPSSSSCSWFYSNTSSTHFF